MYWIVYTWRLFTKKKLNHIGETECLRSNKKKNLLHSDGPQNHQKAPTTEAQKIMKSGRFLGGGAPVRFFVNGFGT